MAGPHDPVGVDEGHPLGAVDPGPLGATVRAPDLTLILDRLPAAPGSALAIDLDRCREAGQRLFGDAKGFLGEIVKALAATK